ncbi:hypothetical protein RHO12_02725 [Orbus sturtevantii]|uniref:fimbrial protein n=1 Tax=Orbus sturtevantii TaxID=3074109 RepID=UPI00370D6838
MMKKLIFTLLSMMLLSAVSYADDTITVNITGKVTQQTCSVTSSQTEFDFGALPLKMLGADNNAMDFNLTFSCLEKKNIKVRLQDNQYKPDHYYHIGINSSKENRATGIVAAIRYVTSGAVQSVSYLGAPSTVAINVDAGIDKVANFKVFYRQAEDVTAATAGIADTSVTLAFSYE